MPAPATLAPLSDINTLTIALKNGVILSGSENAAVAGVIPRGLLGKS